jgi:hypothetical protein
MVLHWDIPAAIRTGWFTAVVDYGELCRRAFFVFDNLPGINGGVVIPCLFCSSYEPPFPPPVGSTGPLGTDDEPDDNGPEDDNVDDGPNDTSISTSTASTSTRESCTSSTTSTLFPETVRCTVTSTSTKGYETTKTTFSTSTEISMTVGCDMTATEETTTTTTTPSPVPEVPLTMDVFTVKPSSTLLSMPDNHQDRVSEGE